MRPTTILSHYHPRYIRSLVYMLQATEYSIVEYFKWYGRVIDFRKVEKRKKLDLTIKARMLMLIAWVLIGVWVWLGLSNAMLLSSLPLRWVTGVLIVLSAPYLVALLLPFPLLVLGILQRPLEGAILRKATATLRSHQGYKIAISGGYGKTTMREILNTVLSEGKKVGTPQHNHNTPLGISRFVASLSGNEDVLVFELGEYYPGDVRELCEMINPDLGVITGVSEVHLDKFKTVERARQTVFELSDWLGTKPVYVNGESDLAKPLVHGRHILYSREGVEDWKVSDAVTTLQGTDFVARKGSTKLKLHTELLGLHQIGPLMAVIAIAESLGLSDEQIIRGIAQTKPFDHRLKAQTDSSGVTYIDDSYNGNPQGVKAVIEFLASLPSKQRFYVTPGLVEMGDVAEVIHREIGGRLADSGIENVVLIRNSVTPFIAQGLEEKNFQGTLIWFDEALEAFAALKNLTARGDIVLLQNDWPDQYY